MRPLYFLLFLGLTFNSGLAFGQSELFAGEMETGALFSTNARTPFSFYSNQYGIVPQNGSFQTVRGGIEKKYRPENDTTKQKKKWDWGFLVNAVANFQPNNDQLLLPEAFGKIRHGWLELYAGNRREVVGLGDSTLSSGFVAWSGNAPAFPKIQLQTVGYVPLKFTKGFFSLKFSYAHGWFTDSYIQNAYLHQKQFYVRLGKPRWGVKLYAGINHQVQWGGQADYLKGTVFAIDGQLPSSLRDYASLVLGNYPDELSNDRYTVFDGTNRIGNHVGSYDLALEWRSKKATWTFYHQHIYEDASGLALQNFPDGLTGLSFQNHGLGSGFGLKRLVIEYLNTTNQSGGIFDGQAQFQGSDNYFNHGQYIRGWSYLDQTIGTPYLAPRRALSPETLALGANDYFPNNRLIMGYLAAQWLVFKRATLISRVSFSDNYGNFTGEYLPAIQQFSAVLSAQIPVCKWPKTVFILTAAFDDGGLYVPSQGCYIGLKKTW